jgi:hypothetical protein
VEKADFTVIPLNLHIIVIGVLDRSGAANAYQLNPITSREFCHRSAPLSFPAY